MGGPPWTSPWATPSRAERYGSAVVEPAVVVAAERDHFGEVGPTACGPGPSMVELAPGVRDVAALSGAAGVAGGACDALGLAEEPLAAAEVERKDSDRRGRRARARPGRRAGGPRRRRPGRRCRGRPPSPGRGGRRGRGRRRPSRRPCRGGGRSGGARAAGRTRGRGRGQGPRAPGPSAPRRGAVIASRTFRRMEAASVGTRKWPLVVPSPWSCRVSRACARAACSSSTSCWSSWASTTDRSCSTASSARRATRRSWTGSSRCALSTSDSSTCCLCSRERRRGSREVAWAMTDACAVEISPAPSAACVAPSRSSRSPASRASRAALAEPDRVCVANHAPEDRAPDCRGTSALSAAATRRSLSASSRRTARSTSVTTAAYSPGSSSTRSEPVQRLVHPRHHGARVTGVRVEVEECRHGPDSSRTDVRIPL